MKLIKTNGIVEDFLPMSGFIFTRAELEKAVGEDLEVYPAHPEYAQHKWRGYVLVVNRQRNGQANNAEASRIANFSVTGNVVVCKPSRIDLRASGATIRDHMTQPRLTH
jgi:hypothetical protein